MKQKEKYEVRKEHLLGTWLTDNIKRQIRIQADKRGLTLSEYVRILILKDLEASGAFKDPMEVHQVG
jgi:hypothetical protein